MLKRQLLYGGAAVAGLAVWLAIDMPATPARVWQAIKSAR